MPRDSGMLTFMMSGRMTTLAMLATAPPRNSTASSSAMGSARRPSELTSAKRTGMPSQTATPVKIGSAPLRQLYSRWPTTPATTAPRRPPEPNVSTSSVATGLSRPLPCR